MWCEPEFHRAGHGKMFMENKENESLKISAKLVDLEDAEEFLKKSAIGKEKIKIVAGDKKSEKVSMEVTVAWGLHPADEAGCFPVPQVKGYCIV